MNVVIAAGGTGGHLYPAVALAREFQRTVEGGSVLFIGTNRGLEGKVLAHEGLPLQLITAKPFMGGGLRRAMGALLALPAGVWQSLRVLRRQHASLVLGIGGYTSPPVLLGAALLGIPRAIVEPNAYPGLANRLLGPIVHRVFVAFEEAARYFGQRKVCVSGTPIRQEFVDERRDTVVAPGGGGGKTLLVFGGSQGAEAINTAMIEALSRVRSSPVLRGVEVVHQTGEVDYERVRAAYQAAEVRAEVVPFLYDMPRVLRSADLVISRAGAVSVAELTACGKPAILVPLPHAIYQHQARNARVLEQAGAAVVLSQEALTGERLADTVEMLLGDAPRLRSMGDRSRHLGRTDAARMIVRECCSLAGVRDEANHSTGALRA